MATRMQQRRGTAAQWTAANPVLAAGEIGFETDTSKFKMGNGSSAWSALTYFANAAELTAIIDGAPATLNTLNELAAAIGDDASFITTIQTAITNAEDAISDHEAQTTSVHGVADMADLATQNYVDTAVGNAAVDQSELAGVGLDWNAVSEAFDIDSTVATKTYADGAVTTHSSDTTSVHGIADTSALALSATVATDISTAVSTHNADTTGVHGIADTSALATKVYADAAVTTHSAETLSVHGIANTANLATKTYADDAVSTHSADTTSVHGIADTSVLATATTVATAKSEAIAAAGTAADTKVSTAVAALTKSSVGLANVDNTADASKPVSTAQASAIATAKSEAIADATSQVNALLTGAPAALNTLDELAAALGDDANFASTVTTNLGLKAPLASPTFTGTVTLPAAGIVFSDGTQALEGVPSRTPIIQKTASYTLSALTERDDLIEMGSGSAMTVTIPTDATLNFPVGTSIDILQTSTGQVTIAGAGGVTVNATPGLKLRTTWSSCTLFKRAANTWVVYGDLTA
jgi:hypothetical protein